MKKTTLYTYLGTNGTITSAIHLEGIYSVVKYRLDADEDMKLTKDGKNFVDTITVPKEELEDWKEVKI